MSRFLCFALISSVLISVGCASRRIENELTVLQQQPANFPKIRLAQENIRFYVANVPPQVQTGMGFNPGAAVSGAISGAITTPSFVVVTGSAKDASLMHNLFAERRMYDALTELSGRRISASALSDYEIERIEVLGSFPDSKFAEYFGLAMTSFFIPPVANAKTTMECPFEAGFILRKGGEIVEEKRFSILIRGDYKGWYVARAGQAKNLMAEMIAEAEKETALKIIESLYAHFEQNR